ncbi:uncharacterized protein LOC136040842 isoform X3 [Artemia franciscana]|uniref:uncharacterized protein LOC136040842 isoform X3 n=1 Tax=Artemia franciscana TaxID=6661 RepID=UPI0032DA3F39
MCGELTPRWNEAWHVQCRKKKINLGLVSRSLSLPVVEILPDDENETSDKEQRELDFPNTSVIPGDLTEELGVDYFFSLWTVLQDEDISTSDVPFTILAPSNLAKRPSSSILGNPEKLKKLILSHILLGRKILSNDIISSNSSIEERSLEGTSLHFIHTTSGILVNNRRVLRSDVFVPQGTIIILEDYLVDNKDDVIENRIPMIELGTKDESDIGSWKLEEIDLDFGRRVFEAMSNESKPFYEELIDVLSLLKSGTSEFRRYFLQADVSKYFIDDGEYTAFIPMDDAFRKWYPIDWGFNPFEVPEFVRMTILNHVVVGKVKQSSVKDGGILTTLGGKQIIIKKTPNKVLSLNGVPVFDGDTPTSHGNVWFVRDILFVNSAVVRSLQKVHKDKETAPLVTFPWYNSQFLSHVFTELEGRDDFNLLVEYLNGTNAFADNLPSHDEDFSMIRYSFFAPTDEAINRSLSEDILDELKANEVLRKQFLMDHTVSSRLYSTDFVDGAEIEMISGKKVLIHKKNDALYLNQVSVTDEDIFIYNLGNMFILDGVLFTPTLENEEMTTTTAPADMEEFTSGTEDRFAQNIGSSIRREPVRPKFFVDVLAALSRKGSNYRSLSRYLEKATDLDSELMKIGDLTLIAPTNSGFSRWTPADAKDPFYIGQGARRNMFLDHIVKGRVTEEDLKDGATLETLSGKKIPITIAQGKINIGDKAVLEERMETSTGTILFTDSMVFVNFEDINQAISEGHKEKEPVSPFHREPIQGFVPNVIVVPRPFSHMQTFAESRPFENFPLLKAVLTALKNKTEYSDFANYLEWTPELEDELKDQGIRELTLIVPRNDGIKRWTPPESIDPYHGSTVARKNLILDHTIKGAFEPRDLKHLMILGTATKKGHLIKETNGVVMIGDKATVIGEEATENPGAKIIFTDSLISVNSDDIDRAIAEYQAKYGKGPVFIAKPISTRDAPKPGVTKVSSNLFKNSPFLEKTYSSLQDKEDYHIFKNYLERTVDLDDEIRKDDTDGSFTMIIPDNFGITRWLLQDAADPYYVSEWLRKKMLKDHIVKGKLQKEDFVEGAELITVSGKKIPISIKGDSIILADEAIVTSLEGLSDPIAPYINTDSIVFVDLNEMNKALDEFHEKNPPQNPWYRPTPNEEDSVERLPEENPHPLIESIRSFITSRLSMDDTGSQDDISSYREYFLDSRNLSEVLRKSPEYSDDISEYTVLIPTSSGIKRFIPSDAGDYYMMDTSYRDQMILDHILIQPIQSKDLVENATFKTVTGKIINYGSEKGSPLNGMGDIVSGPYPLDCQGRSYIIDSILFFDQDRINQIYAENPSNPFTSQEDNPEPNPLTDQGDYPEGSPSTSHVAPPKPYLLTGLPVYPKSNPLTDSKICSLKNVEGIGHGSQEKDHDLIESIRSFLLSRQATDEISLYREYFLASKNLSRLLRSSSGYSEDTKKYTVFVPTKQGIRQWIPRDTQDVYMVDPSFRDEMIIDHIVPQLIQQKDLSAGSTFETVTGRKIEVAKEGGGLNAMGDITSGPYSLGDEGDLYIVDSILFFHFDRIQKILDQNPRQFRYQS